MTKEYKVAHIHEQGQDLIIIPLESSGISGLSTEAQNGIRDTLQYFATDAGLKGTVCLVWQSGSTLHFLAPQPWHPYFRSIDMRLVQANLNRRLTISYSD